MVTFEEEPEETENWLTLRTFWLSHPLRSLRALREIVCGAGESLETTRGSRNDRNETTTTVSRKDAKAQRNEDGVHRKENKPSE